MAIDPQEIAEENTQRSALAQKGSPTEFAEDPKLATQLAGGGTQAVLEVIKKFQSVPDKPPTPQEQVLKPDPQTTAVKKGTATDLERKKTAAKTVLSPEGQAEFKERGFQADKPENVEVLEEAEDAIAAEQRALEQSTVNVTEQSKRSLTASIRGTDPEKELADEARADVALELIKTRKAGIKSLTDGGDFNFDYMNTGDDINATITALGQVYKDETKVAKRGYVPNNVTIDEVAKVMEDEIGFTRKFLRRRTGEALSAVELTAAREIMVRSAGKLNTLATKISNGGAVNREGVFEVATDLDRLAFRRQMAIHGGIQLQLKGAQTEAARALQSFQIKVGGEEGAVRQAQEARRMLQESGGIELVDSMAKRFLKVADDRGQLNMNGINEMARGGWRAKTRQMLSEAYLAGLLSSPATQFRNLFGTASFMAFQLPAEAIAGMYGAIGRQKNLFLYPTVELDERQVYLDDFIVRFKGYTDSLGDAFRVGKKSFQTEMPAGASKLDVERYSAIAAQSDSYLGKVFDEFGRRARLPFTALLAGDEFFKTMSQRGELYVQANRAYKTAKRNGATDLQAQDEAGMVLLDSQSKADELIDKSKYDTLQSDLGAFGRAAKLVQNADIAGIPVGRLAMPFTVAPTNDAIRSAEFIPFVNLLTPNGAKDLFGKNPKARNLAQGRLTLGAATMTLVSMYAINGQITGATPRDPKVREALPKGWQPWSFVLKGENWPVDEDGNDLPLYDMYGAPNGELFYRSYNGFGPVSSVIGITADTVQRMHVTRDPTLRGNYAAAAVAATAGYYKDLPMLEGISNLADVVNLRGDSVDFNLAKFFRSAAEASSVVAVPGVPGVPNPFSALQRAGGRIVSGTAVSKPREDFEYLTEADILKKKSDGTYFYADPLGRPDYSMIGLPKTKTSLEFGGYTNPLPDQDVMRFMREMDAYQGKNTIFPFRKNKDKVAPTYDSLGRQYGDADMNIYAKPMAAILSNLSGIRLSKSEAVSDWEMELMRISTLTGGWPLRLNPDSKDNLRLSPGTASDWANQSKNVTTIDQPRLGEVTFREALRAMILDQSHPKGRLYDQSTDRERRAQIIQLEDDYLNQGWSELLERPDYANIRQAAEGIRKAKAEGLR